MSRWFTHNQYLYKEPERLTADEARLNRLQSTLSRERERLKAEDVRLSQANKFHINRLKEFESKFGDELETHRRRVEKLNLRDPSIVRSPTNRATISRFFQLQQRRSALLQRANQERRANSFKKSFVDRRQFSFNQFNTTPKSRFGTTAWVNTRLSAALRRQFVSPLLSLPCLDRVVRREVMFAGKHAGRGHRVRHKRGPFSHIGC